MDLKYNNQGVILVQTLSFHLTGCTKIGQLLFKNCSHVVQSTSISKGSKLFGQLTDKRFEGQLDNTFLPVLVAPRIIVLMIIK